MQPEEHVIFSSKADARRVHRRLRDFSVLSRLVDREVHILVPTGKTNASARDLAVRIHNEAR